MPDTFILFDNISQTMKYTALYTSKLLLIPGPMGMFNLQFRIFPCRVVQNVSYDLYKHITLNFQQNDIYFQQITLYDIFIEQFLNNSNFILLIM